MPTPPSKDCLSVVSDETAKTLRFSRRPVPDRRPPRSSHRCKKFRHPCRKNGLSANLHQPNRPTPVPASQGCRERAPAIAAGILGMIKGRIRVLHGQSGVAADYLATVDADRNPHGWAVDVVRGCPSGRPRAAISSISKRPTPGRKQGEFLDPVRPITQMRLK